MRALNLMVRDGAVKKHLQVVRAGGSIGLSSGCVLIAISEDVMLDMPTGEVALDRLDAVLFSGIGSHLACGAVALMSTEDD
jgi:hypothetical protein